MRTRSFLFILAAIVFITAFGPQAQAQTATPAWQSAGTDAARVGTFLKTLQDAMALENHLKVASLVKYPLEAWVNGEAITVRSDSELLSHYHQIFDKTLRQSVAAARTEGLSATADGIAFCSGRLLVRAASDKNASLKIVKISEPAR